MAITEMVETIVPEAVNQVDPTDQIQATVGLANEADNAEIALPDTSLSSEISLADSSLVRARRFINSARAVGSCFVALAGVGGFNLATDTAFAGVPDGIADQRLPQLNPVENAAVAQLHPTFFRMVVSADVTQRPAELAQVNASLAVSDQDGYQPVVSFGFPNPTNNHVKLSLKDYNQDVWDFASTHPDVHMYSAFNEAETPRYGISPKLAARYYAALSATCRTKKCTVMAGDFDPMPYSIKKYLPRYEKDLKHYMGKLPTTWAFHYGEGPVSMTTIRKYLPKNVHYVLDEAALNVGPNQAQEASRLVAVRAEHTWPFQVTSRGDSAPQSFDAGLLNTSDQPTAAYNILLNAVQNNTATSPDSNPAGANTSSTIPCKPNTNENPTCSLVLTNNPLNQSIDSVKPAP